MTTSKRARCSRRDFLRASALAGAGVLGAPYAARGADTLRPLVTRPLGRTGFMVPTLSLGGQASLQWTGEGIDPVAIIAKAYESGIRYFDTSNVYGPSQLNYGRAFRQLGLAPGSSGYGEKRRREVFVATKSGIRVNRGQIEGVNNWTQGKPGSTVVDDVVRSLSQLFGDGEGSFPEGSYLDSVQFHAIGNRAEVDALFDGFESPRSGERIGSLAVLRDLRDGTDHTGMNPDQRRLIRHIGISGHQNSDALMYAFWRDTNNLIDTLLVPANANDRRYRSHLNNVIPVAAAKGVGIVSMKVFSDGAFYGKEARFSREPADVVMRVGTPKMPSDRLVQYPLSVPGVATSIIGIGHIDADPARCQLTRNLRASQIEAPLVRRELAVTEQMAAEVAGGATNYFQDSADGVSSPRNVRVERAVEAGRTSARLAWDCALAAADPIVAYEVLVDGRPQGKVEHRPQVSLKPFVFDDRSVDRGARRYEIVAVDAAGNRAAPSAVVLETLG